jgi:hypothetical protein
MKAPRPLRVELRSSRLAAALVCVTLLPTAMLIAFLPGTLGDAPLRAVMVIAIGGYALWLLRGWARRATARAIVSVEVAVDRRIVITERAGTRIEGLVQPQTYVGAWLTTIVVQPEGARCKRAIAVLPDMLPADDFRRLRVLLRFGQPT